MDIRAKTFAGEAIKQLDFLKDQYGFAGPDVDRGTSPGVCVSVSYYRDTITIEASLVLCYMGEEYVAMPRVVHAPDGTARHGAPRSPTTPRTPAIRCVRPSSCRPKQCVPKSASDDSTTPASTPADRVGAPGDQVRAPGARQGKTADPVLVEVAGVTVGTAIDNRYGVAFHSTRLGRLGFDETQIKLLRAGAAPTDATAAAVVALAREVVLNRGKVSDSALAAATAAGLSAEAVLGLVLECAFASLVGLIDNIAGHVELDAVLVPQAWSPGDQQH